MGNTGTAPNIITLTKGIIPNNIKQILTTVTSIHLLIFIKDIFMKRNLLQLLDNLLESFLNNYNNKTLHKVHKRITYFEKGEISNYLIQFSATQFSTWY